MNTISINWFSISCNLIGFKDCFDASANYQILKIGKSRETTNDNWLKHQNNI